MQLLPKLAIASVILAGSMAVLTIAQLLLDRSGYLGPSSFYRHLDSNHDQSLSYTEWMAYYTTPAHNHPIETCARADFYRADCNQDDRLDWREYHNFRFRRRECETAAVPPLSQLHLPGVAGDSPRSIIGRQLSTQAGATLPPSLQHYRLLLLNREALLKRKYGIN